MRRTKLFNANMGRATIMSLQNGCYKTFEEIFLTYYNNVKHFLSKILRSEKDAENLAQDIFVELWINRQSINTNDSFSTYLYSTTRDAAIKYLKAKLAQESSIKADNDSNKEKEKKTYNNLYAEEINLIIEMAVCKKNIQIDKHEEHSQYKYNHTKTY